jgi:ribonuclease VapC
MVIASSAILALLLGEVEAPSFAARIAESAKRLISTVNALECAIVIESRKGEHGARELDLLLHEASTKLVAMDRE